MRPVTIDEVRDIAQYERDRDAFREGVFAVKRRRRVAVGPRITLTFENHLTVLYQVQEMMRTERIVKDEAIQAEIDVYNELIPPEGSLSATLFVEFTDLATIRDELKKLIGIDRSTWLDLPGGGSIRAEYEPGRQTEAKLASVQYVRFSLTPDQVKQFVGGQGEVAVRISHPNYDHRVVLADETRRDLARDFDR